MPLTIEKVESYVPFLAKTKEEVANVFGVDDTDIVGTWFEESINRYPR